MRTTVDQKLQCMFPARKKWYRNHVSCCGEFPWFAKNNTSSCEGALQIKDHRYRKREDLRNSSCFSNLSCFKSTKFTTESRWQSSLWFLLFNPTFPISACTTQALYSDFDVFADWKRFFFFNCKSKGRTWNVPRRQILSTQKTHLGKLSPSATQAYDTKVYKGERFNQESTTDMQVHKITKRQRPSNTLIFVRVVHQV